MTSYRSLHEIILFSSWKNVYDLVSATFLFGQSQIKSWMMKKKKMNGLSQTRRTQQQLQGISKPRRNHQFYATEAAQKRNSSFYVNCKRNQTQELPKKIWRMAKIIMIPKQGKPTEKPSYPRISLQLVTSKLFEKIFMEQIFTYIENENSITDFQLSFRRKYATTEQVHRVRRVRKICSAVFLNTSQAFNRLARRPAP